MTVARVVGAGLSGLVAAWRLSNAGFDVEVIESESRTGGLIDTLRWPMGIVERGANAFVWTEAVAQLFGALGITPRFGSPDARRRFIFRDGAVHRWPLSPRETLAMAGRRAAAAAGGQTPPRAGESVAAWSTRVYGPHATRWLISPALQGVYGAPADRLAAQAILGLGEGRLLTRRSVLAAPPGGMSEVTDRLTAHLEQRGVRIELGRAVDTLDSSIPTILATGASAAAPLVMPHAPELGDALATVAMTSLTVTTACFPPSSSDLHAFGVLFPRGSDVTALGVRFDSDIFPAPRREWRIETWICTLDNVGPDCQDERRLWDAVAADRRVLTRRFDEPVAVVATVRRDAIPLYGMEIATIRDDLRTLPPWLALAGNYMGRLGVSKLVDVAAEAADRIARYNAVPAVPSLGTRSKTSQPRPVAKTPRCQAPSGPSR
jgi:oxygen-dependent protoporphyrinogen oxidase